MVRVLSRVRYDVEVCWKKQVERKTFVNGTGGEKIHTPKPKHRKFKTKIYMQ